MCPFAGTTAQAGTAFLQEFQALVAASLQKTPGFAMTWKQIFQVLNRDNVSV